jgi:hypothetical protein
MKAKAKANTIWLEVKLHHWSSEPPLELLKPKDPVSCTAEFLPRTLPDKLVQFRVFFHFVILNRQQCCFLPGLSLRSQVKNVFES